MANNIDGELYPDNNSLVVGRPTRRYVNTSGVEIEGDPISGLTDFEAYLSEDPLAETNADAIHPDLVLPLPEEGSTAVYHAVLLGSAKRARMSAIAAGTTIYTHWQSVLGGYHEVTESIWRSYRPGASS